MAVALQTRLLDQVVNDMRERGPVKSVSENAAKARLEELKASNTPQVVIDFPTRGLPSERNLPKEIGDPERKYFTLPARGAGDDDNVFHAVRGLQEKMAMVRVFASPELHELVIRYVQPVEIQQCVESVIDKLRRG